VSQMLTRNQSRVDAITATAHRRFDESQGGKWTCRCPSCKRVREAQFQAESMTE